MGFFSSKRHGVYKNVNGKAVLVENNTETATNTEESTGDFATILPVGEPVALPKEKLDYLLKNGKVVPHEKLSEDATGAELLEDMLNTFSIKVEEKSAQKAKETLNDVFEKLDQNRLEKLLEWVCKKNKGQVFLTDTHQERITKALNQFDVTYHLIQL